MLASWKLLCASALTAVTLVGCGSSGSAPSTAAKDSSPASTNPPALGAPSDDGIAIAARTSDGTPAQLADAPAAEPVEGSPEWNLREIMQVRLLPLPAIDLPDDDADAEGVVEASAEAPAGTDRPTVKEQLAQTREIRRERNQQIVALAMNVLTQTAKNPEQEELFNAGVHHLLDAHLQLALQGDENSIASLYEAAEAFHAKKPGSSAAAEAQLTLVNLAHANALRYAKTEPRWLQEFSRQSQLLATRFPSESNHSLPLLLAAGRSCELHGMTDEAKSCLTLIQTKFPESPQAQQAAGIVRRLNLIGTKLEFAGPTLDGNYVSVEDHANKAVIIVFWATHAKPFLEQAPALQAIAEKYKKYSQVLSVCLDSAEGDIDKFREESHLEWPVIFHVEHDKRGWNSPLAAHYGVTNLPTIWIVDPTGLVAETDVTAETLEPKLREVILKHRATTSAAASGSNSGETPTSR